MPATIAAKRVSAKTSVTGRGVADATIIGKFPVTSSNLRRTGKGVIP
jgi:hypothetical protein